MSVKLTLETDLSKCCDPDAQRHTMCGARATPGDGVVYLAASNGKIAAVVEVRGEVDATHLIPGDICKPGVVTGQPGDWRHAKGRKLTASLDRVEGVFPPVQEVLKDSVKDKPLAVRLDARELANLAKAVTEGESAGFVTLLIRDAGHGIGVLGNAGIGMIMPCYISEKDPDPVAVYRGNVERYVAAVKAAKQ